MGDYNVYQPLTKEDKVSVVVYRTGIVLSSLVMALMAVYMTFGSYGNDASLNMKFGAAVIALYVSVGLSVFFIHLYVGSFHRALKKLYFIAVLSFIVLLVIGGGDALTGLAKKPFGPLLLLPLSGCLGFITAKEAFCFRLIEGYLIALIMPVYLLLLSSGAMSLKGASSGLLLIAVMLVIFTLRKVFMPMHCDIGDKSAYS